MNQNFIIIMNQTCQIYSIKIYVGKNTPNLQQNLREEKKHQIYNIKIYVRNREKKYAKFTISIFTWEKTPNLQHQNLREEKNAKFTTSKFACEKKCQIYNIKNYVRKKQIYNIKIYVRKKTNLQHQNLREEKQRQIHNIKIYVEKNEKFTTSLTTSRTTLDVCQNIDRGRCPNQNIIAIFLRHSLVHFQGIAMIFIVIIIYIYIFKSIYIYILKKKQKHIFF